MNTIPANPEVRVDKSIRMPAGIPFIISNEFAERFCFYGINSILAVFMTQYLQYTEANAASAQALFKSGAYFFPLVGAIIADVLWGKFKTIAVFSTVYTLGCAALAIWGTIEIALAASLFLIGFGTGGIKPCVSTNLGDQFTSKNAKLIERAYSLFYMAINAGSSISIWLCPVLLAHPRFGPHWAFGMPAVMMAIATLVFISGRRKYRVVPPAGRKWVKEVTSPATLKLIGSLLVLYFFVAAFWMLWDQSNGNTWTLQMQSALVDKTFFGYTLHAAQIQVVNGFFILAFAPLFSYVVYPFIERFTPVTPLRRIGAGLFITAASFVIVAWIEREIFRGNQVSALWQVVAYMVLSMGEVLVSITALEFSYKQAPFTMKSFIMALFLLSVSVGNLAIAGVNRFMVHDISGASVSAGADTWVTLPPTDKAVVGQKLDFSENNGISIVSSTGESKPFNGTFVVAEVDAQRARLIDNVTRKSIPTSGTFVTETARISTAILVGPQYFLAFAGVLAALGLIYIPFAARFKEQTFVRAD